MVMLDLLLFTTAATRVPTRGHEGRAGTSREPQNSLSNGVDTMSMHRAEDISSFSGGKRSYGAYTRPNSHTRDLPNATHARHDGRNSIFTPRIHCAIVCDASPSLRPPLASCLYSSFFRSQYFSNPKVLLFHTYVGSINRVTDWIFISIEKGAIPRKLLGGGVLISRYKCEGTTAARGIWSFLKPNEPAQVLLHSFILSMFSASFVDTRARLLVDTNRHTYKRREG